MTKFIAMKVHYDHRPSLPEHLKYSRPPTLAEYQEYLTLFRSKGIGGEGFHECLNFAIPDEAPVKIYLPPTCLPDEKHLNEEFVIFSFTYKQDPEMPACIVGVHAGARIINKDGIERLGVEQIEGIDFFFYHAEAPADLVTLITPAIQYDFREGRFTPAYKSWGYGLRYLKEEHAKNIVAASLEQAQTQLPLATDARRLVIERQITALTEIENRYLTVTSLGESKKRSSKSGVSQPPLPDKELGYLGEKLVYEKELAYAGALGARASEVEWVSQAVPASPFDIKTIRKTATGYREHFLEVKSSKIENSGNVFISAGQVKFFEENSDRGSFMFVTFDLHRNPSRTRELSLAQLLNEFDLVPIKFTLRGRSNNGG